MTNRLEAEAFLGADGGVATLLDALGENAEILFFSPVGARAVDRVAVKLAPVRVEATERASDSEGARSNWRRLARRARFLVDARTLSRDPTPERDRVCARGREFRVVACEALCVAGDVAAYAIECERT